MADRIHVPNNYYSDSFINPTRRYLLQLLRVDVRLVRAFGTRLWDTEGREYLDFLSQYGALAFGHNNPMLWDALLDCFKQEIPSMVQPLIAIKAEELAARLASISPGELTYSIFTNSGAETVEVAIKLARSRTGRIGILSTQNGFHGQTLGALSATGRPIYHKRFGVPLPNFYHVPFGDLEALEKKLNDEGDSIAAFIVEPIQGEGGIHPAPKGYLNSAQALCRRHGILFIADEIQTGLGRTGNLFAVEHDNVVPDMLLLSKALGGGLTSIGACIIQPHLWDHHFGYVHNSTLANNNIATSVALRVLDMLARDDWAITKEAGEKGEYILQRLRTIQQKFPGVVKDVRGRGLMVGVEFFPFDGNESYTMSYFSKGDLLVAVLSGYLFNVHRIITAPAFNQSHVLRIEPPLIITRKEIDTALNAVESLVSITDSQDFYKIVRYVVGDSSKPKDIKCYRRSRSVQIGPTESSEKDLERFAFLMHPIYEQDILSADPSFAQFTVEEFNRWKNWIKDIGPGTVYHVPEVRSITGKAAEGWMIVLPILPKQMLRYGSKNILPFFYQAVDIAKDLGAKILGLGGFTAIISRGGEKLLGRGLPITTGNTLTAILGVEGIKEAAKKRNINLQNAQVVVVGATGAIGRLASLLLAPLVGKLTLLGNPSSMDSLVRCRAIADEIYKEVGAFASRDYCTATPQERLDNSAQQKAGISTTLPEIMTRTLPEKDISFLTVSNRLQEALTNASVIVLATSSDSPILKPEDLMEGAIVCDIARPSNVFPEVAKNRPDVYLFEGGMAQLPYHASFGPELPHHRSGNIVGCLAETILLSLEGEYSNHSISSSLSLAEASLLRSIMYKHGFRLAPLPQ